MVQGFSSDGFRQGFSHRRMMAGGDFGQRAGLGEGTAGQKKGAMLHPYQPLLIAWGNLERVRQKSDILQKRNTALPGILAPYRDGHEATKWWCRPLAEQFQPSRERSARLVKSSAGYKMPVIFSNLYPDLYPREQKRKKANPKIGLIA